MIILVERHDGIAPSVDPLGVFRPHVDAAVAHHIAPIGVPESAMESNTAPFGVTEHAAVSNSLNNR